MAYNDTNLHEFMVDFSLLDLSLLIVVRPPDHFRSLSPFLATHPFPSWSVVLVGLNILLHLWSWIVVGSIFTMGIHRSLSVGREEAHVEKPICFFLGQLNAYEKINAD